MKKKILSVKEKLSNSSLSEEAQKAVGLCVEALNLLEMERVKAMKKKD